MANKKEPANVTPKDILYIFHVGIESTPFRKWPTTRAAKIAPGTDTMLTVVAPTANARSKAEPT
jgi:hypothetical protein